jgi:RND family efflux transporter MFP subunit
MAGSPDKAASSTAQAVDVATVRVLPAEYRANIEAFGEAEAHYQLSLSTQVAGRIEMLNDAFENGKRIAQGEALLQLEDSSYKAAVASAEKDLADAKLALLEEERQGIQAEAEWKASGLGGNPDSVLVLRKPQFAAAEAAVTTSQAALDSARHDLAQTHLTAPFDALVVERLVSPGAYVQAGTEVATLYSTDRIEISVGLSARDWQNLPDSDLLIAGDWAVELTDVETAQQWTGRVVRLEQHLNDTTRQRAIIVAVDQPLDQNPALFPGTFVKARLSGVKRDKLWKLPVSALSQRGEVWYVTASNTLAKVEITPVFGDADSIYVPVPDELAAEPQQVLVHPLNGYLEGMRINPVEEKRDEE